MWMEGRKEEVKKRKNEGQEESLSGLTCVNSAISIFHDHSIFPNRKKPDISSFVTLK